MTSSSDDLASLRYEFSLKCRIFRKWKHLYFDADVKPIKEVLIVAACFKWMCISLGDYKSSSFFPEYAAIEPDGNSSNYFKDRLRLYMKDKLHFPARNFPLLIHAIALFDAHQLVCTFKAWREHVHFCTKLDLFARQLRTRRCFLQLQKFAYAQKLLEYKHRRISSRQKKRVMKNCLVVWHIHYKSLAFLRLRTLPRKKANILFTLRIALNLNKYERFSINNGVRFHLTRRRIRSYRLWLQRLSHAPALDALHSDVLLKQLLLEIVLRHYLVSLSYNKLVRQVASSRSHFFRNHRLVFYVVRSIYDNLPVNVMEMFAKVKDAWIDDDLIEADLSRSYSTPLHHAGRHDILNNISAIHASRYRDQTPTSPGSDNEYPSPVMSPYSPRSVFETPVHDRDRSCLQLSDLSSEKKQKVRVVVVPDRPEVSGAVNLSHIARMHNQIYCSSMKLLHQNLSSRQSQLLELRVATHFRRYRSLSVSLRRWMGWVPQSKLNRMDSLAAPLFYSPKTMGNRFSVPGDGHVYLYFKSLQLRFKQWRWTARRKGFLRERSRFITRRVQLAVQSRVLGSWLICTARYEQYRRVENRVLNTRLSKQLYLSFYAWRVLIQRIQLLRNNERQRVIDRNNCIRQFVDNKYKSDATRSQSTILRTWSLHIRNLKRGRMLVAKWTKTAGTRFLFLALHRWRLVCHLDLIATCFKKIWLGFKARRITHGREYEYLRWFQPQIRKYQYFRSRHCKQLIFGILKRFVSELCILRNRDVSHVHFRRAVRMLRRFKSKIKMCRRLAGRASVSRDLRCNKTVFVRLKEMMFKGRSLRVHTLNNRQATLKKTLLRLLSTATLSSHLRAVALKSDRRLATYAFQQFRAFHRHMILRGKLNARRVRAHLLRSHLKKLIAFNRRRQRVFLFQDFQRMKKARRLLAFWCNLVDTRNFYYRVSRDHFRRFKQRSYLRSWLKVTRRRLYGQVEPGSAFQVSARRRLLQRLMKARLIKAFGRFRRLVYSYRKQRLSARYITTSRNNRLIARAYQKLKYHWFKKHRSLYSHRLKDVSTSVRRGLLHEALYKLMTLNLTRNHSDNLRFRAMHKWMAKSRTRSKALRLDARCVKQYRRTVLKQFLRRLLKNVIKQKKKRHVVGLQRREIRKHSLLLVFHKMYSRHRKRGVHYNALKKFHQDRMIYLSMRLLYRTRVAVRYKAKHLRFRFVKRLKQMGRFFFARLRYFVTRVKRSPARQALIRIGRKKRRMAFKRFKLRCVRVITSRLIQEHALMHHLRRKALKCLRFWRRYLFLKKRLHAIRRKFLMVPRFRAWHQLAIEQIHSTRAVRHMTKRTGLRVKRNYMYLWKLFTVRESRLKMQTHLVQQLIVNRLKGRVLYMWMRLIDDRVIHSKFHRVKAIHAKATLRRSFFEWHKTYLVSYLASCKTAKASLRSWHSVTFWRKRQARLTQTAVIVHDRTMARKSLLFWLWEARRMLILRRRMTVRRMKSTVKKYLRWFRRWQWRVSVVVYSSKYHCYPHHKNSIVFAKYRALAKWRRFNKIHRQHKRKRKLSTHLTAWRRLTHTAKFAREAFTNRLSAFKRKHSLAYCFSVLLSSCKELQTQRMWCNFVSLMQQSRVFDFWRRLYQQRMAEKLKVANSMRGIYKVQKFHMFRIWKVKVIHAYKINRILIKQDTLRRWTTLLAVRRHHRAYLRRSFFRAWRVYIYSLDMKVRAAQGVRRRVGALVYRKMRDHLLLTMLAFKRWRDRDSSVHLWDFFKHAHLLARHSVYGAQTVDLAKSVVGSVNAHKVAAAASLRASVQQHNLSVKIYEQLAHSHAGHMLVQDLEHSRQTRNSPRARATPHSRVLELQANLQRRFSAADAKHLPSSEVDINLANNARRPRPLDLGGLENVNRARSHSPTHHQPRAVSPNRHLSEGLGQPVRATSGEPAGRGLHIKDLTHTAGDRPLKGVMFRGR